MMIIIVDRKRFLSFLLFFLVVELLENFQGDAFYKKTQSESSDNAEMQKSSKQDLSQSPFIKSLLLSS
jgi:hypothetical protein